jgi:predicted ATPase
LNAQPVKSRVVLVPDGKSVELDPADVGIGISQLLPAVILSLAYEESALAIEQPELHLHPALQAEVADLFVESALGERRNTLIIETHSEHLILRVMRRMRDTVRGQRGDAPPVRPEDVAVLFVEPTANGSIVHELRLKPDGSLLDPWPGGFFEESFSEIFG